MKVAICLDCPQFIPDTRAGEYTRALLETMMERHPGSGFLYIPPTLDHPANPPWNPGPQVRTLNFPSIRPILPFGRLRNLRKRNFLIRDFEPQIRLGPAPFGPGRAPFTLLFPDLFFPDLEDPGIRRGARACEKILCVSDHARGELLRMAPGKKVRVVSPAARPWFHPLSLPERREIKGTHSGGMEYLVCAENPDPTGFLWVLKAFSGMKQKVSTQMKLLFTRIPSGPEEKWRHTLESFHFGPEVILAKGAQPEAAWIAAAYAMILPPGNPAQPLVLAEAMACGVPALVSGSGTTPQQSGAEVLRADTPEEAAVQLTVLYKDEKLRAAMSRHALELAAARTWDGTVERIWECLEEV